MTFDMGVLASSVFAWDIEHDEIPAHSEGDLTLELPGRQITPHVPYQRQMMDRHALHRRRAHCIVRSNDRLRLWRDRINVTDDSGGIASHDRMCGHGPSDDRRPVRLQHLRQP